MQRYFTTFGRSHGSWKGLSFRPKVSSGSFQKILKAINDLLRVLLIMDDTPIFDINHEEYNERINTSM